MTALKSPCGELPTEDKVRVQCLIDNETYNSLFNSRFPMRGAQDRILSSLLVWFDKAMTEKGMLTHFDLTNEAIAQEFLDKLHANYEQRPATSA